MSIKPQSSSKVAGAPSLRKLTYQYFRFLLFSPEPAEVRKQLEHLVLRPQ